MHNHTYISFCSRILLIVAVFTIASCSIDNDGPSQSTINKKIEKYERSNKGELIKTDGIYEFKLSIKTAEIMARQELKNKKYDQNTYIKTLASFQGMNYFTLSIRRTDSNGDIVKEYGTTDEEHEKIIKYLSFEMQNDCSIITAGDTLPCKIYHYERNYGVTPYSDISLGFEKSKETENILALVFHDNFFGEKDIIFDLRNHLSN
jgi:hypothetical protein